MCVICNKMGMKVEGARAFHFIRCPAYHDDQGNREAVHEGHCTGVFPGAKPCRYYIGNKPEAASVSWCGLEQELAMRREARARVLGHRA